MKIILDSNIYEFADCQINILSEQLKHFKYLSDIIEFIKEQKLKIICSEKEYLAIINFKAHPWNQYENHKNLNEYSSLQMIYYDLTRLMNFEKNDSTKAKPLSQLHYCSLNESICFNEFLKHIALLNNSDSNQYIVLMGTSNHHLNTPLKFELNDQKFDIEPIMNINDDNVKNFSNGYRNLLLSKKDIKPTLTNPLPNSDLCKQYEKWQQNKINNRESTEAIYRQAVREVALRNGYCPNKRLSQKNSNSGVIRDIYTSNTNPVIHISADIRHGRIEVFNNLGKHQGEYSYEGVRKKDADSNGRHDIVV